MKSSFGSGQIKVSSIGTWSSDGRREHFLGKERQKCIFCDSKDAVRKAQERMNR